MSKNHATLSPSSAHRWLKCTPSAMLELEFENKSNTAAEEGTAAHAYCEHLLKKALKRRSKRPVSPYDCDEMQECAESYVDYVLEQLDILKNTCSDPLVLIEQKVDFSDYVEGGFGTADCLIIADDKLLIFDYKHGQGTLVDAYENPQMKCYALGALAIYEDLYDIKEVVMTIFQPRRENISVYTLSVSELKQWANDELKVKAQMALKGEGEFQCGSWCKFCKAANRCRKRAEEKLKLAELEFKMPPLLSDDEISEVLRVLPDLTKWADDILAYASDAAITHGKRWEGFKLVEGRSVRKYKDEDEIIRVCKDNGYEDIFKSSLIGLTEMQKLMGKKNFDELLGNLIIKPKGKLTLVPNEDKRKEVTVQTAKQEFNEI